MDIKTKFATGYVEKRTKIEIEKDAERTKKAMELGIIGVFDSENDENNQKEKDRDLALTYIYKDEEIPEELLKRLLKYKEEEENK